MHALYNQHCNFADIQVQKNNNHHRCSNHLYMSEITNFCGITKYHY